MKGLGLIGRKESGKSASGEYLAERFGFKIMGFADPLREMAAAINPIVLSPSGAVYRYNDVLATFGYEQAKKDFPEVRQFLQRLGTEAGRQVLGDTFWLDVFEKRSTAAITAGQPVVVTDVRFPNEADMLTDLGFEIVRVIRPGTTESGDTHPSETALDEYITQHVIRNEGSLDDLHTEIEVLMFAMMMEV